jgi:hypothetical protein
VTSCKAILIDRILRGLEKNRTVINYEVLGVVQFRAFMASLLRLRPESQTKLLDNLSSVLLLRLNHFQMISTSIEALRLYFEIFINNILTQTRLLESSQGLKGSDSLMNLLMKDSATLVPAEYQLLRTFRDLLAGKDVPPDYGVLKILDFQDLIGRQNKGNISLSELLLFNLTSLGVMRVNSAAEKNEDNWIDEAKYCLKSAAILMKLIIFFNEFETKASSEGPILSLNSPENSYNACLLLYMNELSELYKTVFSKSTKWEQEASEMIFSMFNQIVSFIKVTMELVWEINPKCMDEPSKPKPGENLFFAKIGEKKSPLVFFNKTFLNFRKANSEARTDSTEMNPGNLQLPKQIKSFSFSKKRKFGDLNFEDDNQAEKNIPVPKSLASDSVVYLLQKEDFGTKDPSLNIDVQIVEDLLMHNDWSLNQKSRKAINRFNWNFFELIRDYQQFEEKSEEDSFANVDTKEVESPEIVQTQRNSRLKVKTTFDNR